MQEVRLWAIEADETGEMVATSVETLQSAETEAKLEDILVRSPDMLMENLTLSLTERTESGRTAQRVYVSVYLNYKGRGSLIVSFQERGIMAAGQALKSFQEQFSEGVRYYEKYNQVQVYLTATNWPKIKPAFEPVLTAMVAGWKAKERGEGEGTATGQQTASVQS